jgi:hypothetical protein
MFEIVAQGTDIRRGDHSLPDGLMDVALLPQIAQSCVESYIRGLCGTAPPPTRYAGSVLD